MNGRARVLLLEDDFVSQRMAVAMLENAGYLVDTKDASDATYDAVVRGVTKPVEQSELLSAVSALMSLPDAVLDLDLVEQLRVLGRDVDDGAFFPELVEQFVSDAEGRLSSMRAAAAAPDVDVDAVGRLAHALKGAGAQLGGRRLAEACTAVQVAAEGGVPGQLVAAVDDAEREYELLRAALTDEVQRGG